jgi:hypothetical protein
VRSRGPGALHAASPQLVPEVCNTTHSYLCISSFKLVIYIYFHFVVQATHIRASSPSALGRGGPHAVRFATGGAQVALWLRLPAGLRAPGPVAPRDAQLPLLLGEMAVTLEDVALLFGLPCSGELMGAADPRAVARHPPSEVHRSGALSRRARGA